MAFNAGNESTPFKLYTGLADVQVVAVNPTKEEAEKLGINMKNDPVYVSTDETSGNKKCRIDIYVKSDKTGKLDKLAFFMEDAKRLSSAGNTQWINDFGKSCFAASVEEAIAAYQWFKPDGARESVTGEPELVDFVKNLLNIPADAVAKLDNPRAFFTGNVSELKAIFKQYPERKVQVHYYIREIDGNYYQAIYSRYFSRAGNTKTTYWAKHFEGSTTKLNYQNSFAWQEFNPLSQGAPVEKSTEDAPNIWG